jgi:hypothetical protein
MSLIVCVVGGVVTITFFNESFGSSPPFVVEQFYDNDTDWLASDLQKPQQQIKSDIRNDTLVSECTNNHTIRIPDITGVSYRSDGRILKSTIWLREPFDNPSLLHDTTMMIEMVNVSKPLQYASVDNSHVSIQDHKFNFSNVDGGLSNETSSGFPKETYIYTTRDGGLMIVEKEFPIYYVLTFKTKPELFNEYWPRAKVMFDSFDIRRTPGPTSLLENDPISLLNISLPYDDDIWELIRSNKFPPLSATFAIEPHYAEVLFRTTINALSFPTYSSDQADYTTSLSWKSKLNQWKKAVDELYIINSTLQPGMKYLQNRTVFPPDFRNSITGGSHVDLDLNLESIGSPEHYIVVSDVSSKFIKKNEQVVCHLKDFTNWIPLPPPKIEIDTDPESWTMRQGDKKPIKVLVNSSVNVPAYLNFSARLPETERKSSPMELIFDPQNLSLPANGASSTMLNVKAKYDPINGNNSTRDFTINVDAEVEFPLSLVDTASTLPVQDNKIETIRTMASPIRISIQPPMEIPEKISNVFHASASSLAAFGGIVTTIGTIAASFVIFMRWITKRKSLTAEKDEDFS